MSISISPKNGEQLAKIMAILEDNDMEYEILGNRDGEMFELVKDAYESDANITKSMIDMCNLAGIAEAILDNYTTSAKIGEQEYPEDMEFLISLSEFAIESGFDIDGGQRMISAIKEIKGEDEDNEDD